MTSSTTTPPPTEDSVVSFAHKEQVEGIGSELFQFLDPATTQTQNPPPPPPPPAERAHQALQRASLLFDTLSPAATEEEDAAEDASKQTLIKSLTLAYSTVNTRCEKLEADIRMKKLQQTEAIKLRYELQTAIQAQSQEAASALFNKQHQHESEGEDSETAAAAATGTPVTPLVNANRKRRKSAVAKPASSAMAKRVRGGGDTDGEDDDNYGSDDMEPGERATRVSSGACPQCGKLRHRDKKMEPNICPFLLWTKDFGRQVPRKHADENLLAAQKNAWPLVKQHFVDANGMYVKQEGSKWNGPSSAA